MKYFLLPFLIGILSGYSNAGIYHSIPRAAKYACDKYSTLPTYQYLSDVPAVSRRFPWTVSLGYQNGSEFRFLCGGTVISQHFILTAGHCVAPGPPILVRSENLSLTDNDANRTLNYEVDKIIVHPNYTATITTKNVFQNDIALIRLIKPLTFTTKIAPACLHTNMHDLSESRWGIVESGQPDISNGVLLRTQVKTMPLHECNSKLLEWNGESNCTVFESEFNYGEFCTYDPERRNNSYHADGGSTLQYFATNESKIATVVGILSFSINCDGAVPSVYTSAAKYLYWIESIVWPSITEYFAWKEYKEYTRSSFPLYNNEFPWMAALGYNNSRFELSFHCSGTIISDYFIMTSAYCTRIENKSLVLVRLEIWNRHGNYYDDNYSEGVNYGVQKIFRHPNYSATTKENDIALIRVNSRISYTVDIGPAVLPMDESDERVDVKLTETGWFSVKFFGSDRFVRWNNVLSTSLWTMPLSTCNETLMHINISANYSISEKQYCASNPRTSSYCYENNGGPLLLYSRRSYFEPIGSTVIGIATHDVRCDTSMPRVYTRVGYYLVWINSIVWPLD